jgi:hypothetical protein
MIGVVSTRSCNNALTKKYIHDLPILVPALYICRQDKFFIFFVGDNRNVDAGEVVV